MGRRWAWMGMVGVCALLTGCRERGSHEQAAPISARTPAPARPGASTSAERVSPATPASTGAQQSVAPAAAPALATPRAQGVASAQGTAPAQASTRAPPSTNTVAQQPAPAAPRGTTVTESGATQEAAGRVMIGLEAVQANEDEAWYEGAAKAARAARQNDSVPLERVVIATGTVDGRVTRVERGTLHVRDSEGNVYQLRVDKRTRGLRQGQSVPLHQLEEGTPVRASFDLVAGSSIARDIEVRR